MAELFKASWGKIQLFASKIHAQNSRTQVVHDLTSGDVHPTQDRGRRALRTRVELVFDEFPGQGPPIDAAKRLKAAVDSGATAVFTHPMDETPYIASVGDFDYEMDEHGVVSGTAEFISEDAVPGVSPTGGGTGGVSGENSVNQAADDLDTELEAVGLTAGAAPPLSKEEVAAFISDPTKPLPALSLTDDARIAVGRWQDTDRKIRQVMIDTARISDTITKTIDDNGLEHDLQLWGALSGAIVLGDSMRAAATAATSESSSVFVMRITERTALLPLAARVYGGRHAQERAAQIVDLNDIQSPGWLDPGDYYMPARPAQSRLAI